jgi:tetraacyldisaccharide 4'-kinase
LRGVLRLCEIPYGWAIRYRNHRYRNGSFPITRVPVPVVSVGNITTGGTGKTPLVAWLARWFEDRGVQVALVSRGYKAEGEALNDEARELKQVLPNVPHHQDRDRVAAARKAIEVSQTQLIVLDDGFQHRRLHRDLDIVLIDALDPFGYDHLLPRGLLREPKQQLCRADIIALSRAETITVSARQSLREEVQRLAPHTTWIELAHRPQRLVQADGHERSLDFLAGARVAAFSGIGNPTGFRHSLEQLGCNLVAFRAFADHHAFDRADMVELTSWLKAAPPVDFALCTGKDLVKVRETRLGNVPLFALRIDIEVMAGQAELESRLLAVMP